MFIILHFQCCFLANKTLIYLYDITSFYLVDFFVMSFFQFSLGADKSLMLAHMMFGVFAWPHDVIAVVMVMWTMTS